MRPSATSSSSAIRAVSRRTGRTRRADASWVSSISTLTPVTARTRGCCGPLGDDAALHVLRREVDRGHHGCGGLVRREPLHRRDDDLGRLTLRVARASCSMSRAMAEHAAGVVLGDLHDLARPSRGQAADALQLPGRLACACSSSAARARTSASSGRHAPRGRRRHPGTRRRELSFGDEALAPDTASSPPGCRLARRCCGGQAPSSASLRRPRAPATRFVRSSWPAGRPVTSEPACPSAREDDGNHDGCEDQTNAEEIHPPQTVKVGHASLLSGHRVSMVRTTYATALVSIATACWRASVVDPRGVCPEDFAHDAPDHRVGEATASR